MTFANLLQRAQVHAARTFSSTTAATAGAWFGTSATAAPATRAAFSVAISDVTQGPPRITRDPLSGTVNTPTGTIRISFPVASLTFTPVSNDTICLIGTTRATAGVYRVTAVETAGGVYELECRQEPQYLT